MLIGSLASPIAVRRVQRERLVPIALAIIGVCVFLGATLSSLFGVAALWFIGGGMSGTANVCYESLLQERTPDRWRGRVMATVEATQEATYLLGVALAAVLSSIFATPEALMSVGAITCVAALVGFRLLQPASGELATDAFAEPQVARATELRTRPNAVTGGPWPHWVPALPAAWTVTRDGSVVHVHMQWPLVATDWSAIIQELSQAIEKGVKVVVLPTKLPAGSRVPPARLDELWQTLVDMSITVERSAKPVSPSSEVSVR
jgi:MFS family permease